MNLNLKEKNGYKNFINGKWVPSSGKGMLESINPANPSQIVGYVQNSTTADLERAITSSKEAKRSWRKYGQVSRGQLLYKAADIMEKRLDEIAKTLTLEMGKPFSEAKGEATRGVAILRYYAGEGYRKSGDVIPASDSKALMTTNRYPLGSIAVITPWNFPVAIPIWKIAPALVYGNTIVFKPASEAAVTAAKVVECLVEAGLPDGVLNFVTGSGSVIGQKLIEHRDIDGITFTGSESIGKAVAKSAAENGIKYQLEMGGKNPVIVSDSANLEQSIEAIISGGLSSTGQKCTATSRVIVHEAVYDEFRDRLAEKMKQIKIGSGLSGETRMGPCASEKQLKTIKRYIEKGKEEGATLVYGGKTLEEESLNSGFYIEPTLFENVHPDMVIAKEEIFGPVLALMRYSETEEAIALANHSKYGLSASIFTENIDEMLDFMEDMEAGLVRVNAESAGVELQAPFGGMKESSSGSREQGEAAKEFYTSTKTFFVKRAK